MENKTTFIYTLSTKEEPGNIRYIGKANDPKDRGKRHLHPHYLKEGSYKANWLKSELKKGNTPVLKIIDEVSIDDWQFWESYWIEQFIYWGFKLTNGTAGGEGFNLTKDILDKRNETNFNRGTVKLQEELKKYNIRLEGDKWIAERNCPKCNKLLTYEHKKRHNALKAVRKGYLNKRTCLSCRDYVKNLGKHALNRD